MVAQGQRTGRRGRHLASLRLWLSKSWQIAVLMTKGSYLLAERRRLLVKLGEEVYTQMMKGQWNPQSLEPTVHQVDRLTKKIALEEVLINRLRFGKRREGKAVQT